MTIAREIMTGGAECVGAEETVAEAARKMAQLGVGALPICGTDQRLKGMLTDRDIVVKVLGKGLDPPTRRQVTSRRVRRSPLAPTTTPRKSCAP